MALRSTLTGTWQTARIVAATVPVLRARDPESAERARRHLAGVLGQLRGLPTKLGQWLATGAEGEAYAPCAESLTPMPWPRMRALLAEAWAVAPESVLPRIEPQGHAASLGQVHRAWLADGRCVAVKIRYPDIAADIAAVLAALALVPGLGPARTYGLDLAGHRQMLRETLDRELDYRHEAAVQQRAAAFAGPGVVVPRIHAGLCRDGILVQDWEDGETLAAAAAWDQAARDAAGHALVRRFLRQTLRERLLHADPNPGNLRLRRDAGGVSIVQYDHGCMLELAPERAAALRRLVLDHRRGSGSPSANLAAVRFDATKLAHLEDRLGGILTTVLAPLLTAGAHAAGAWHPAQELNQLLGADRWWFRAAGSPELFLLTRAFGGLVRHLQGLACHVDWNLAWSQALDETLPSPTTVRFPPSAAAPRTRLHVRVTAGPDPVAEIDLPAASAIDLPALLAPAVAEALTRLGLDLEELIAGCQRDGWRPRDLIDTPYRRPDGALRHIRVWLQ